MPRSGSGVAGTLPLRLVKLVRIYVVEKFRYTLEVSCMGKRTLDSKGMVVIAGIDRK